MKGTTRQERQKLGMRPDIDVFIENLPGNVYRRVRRLDGTYTFEYLSSGLFRQFGIDHERLLAEHSIRFDWVHPDDRKRMVSDLEVSAATLGLLDHRIRVIGQNDTVHWARGIGRPTRRANGCVAWDGIVIDISREIEAEAALHLAKQEADRALATAAAIVTGAAGRLGGPLREFAAILEALPADMIDDDARRELLTCQGRMTLALAGLGSGVQGAAPEWQDRAATLTKRQAEVFRLVSAGLSNKVIAQRLGITPGTAKLHVAAVLRSMGASKRGHLLTSRAT